MTDKSLCVWCELSNGDGGCTYAVCPLDEYHRGADLDSDDEPRVSPDGGCLLV